MKMILKNAWMLLLFFAFRGFGQANPDSAKIEALLKQMTLEEKVQLLHGNSSFTSGGVPRLGIPGFVTSVGPHTVVIAVRPATNKNRHICILRCFGGFADRERIGFGVAGNVVARRITDGGAVADHFLNALQRCHLVKGSDLGAAATH